MIKDTIKQAVLQMTVEDEFSKMKKHFHGLKRREIIKAEKNLLNLSQSFGGIENIPIVVLVESICSAEVWKDIAVYMLSEDAMKSAIKDGE